MAPDIEAVAQQVVGEAALKQPWHLKFRRDIAITREAGAVPRRLVWGALVGSRGIIWASALGAMALFGPNTAANHLDDPAGVTAAFHVSWLNWLFAPAARWDSVWYLQIAHVGYFSRATSAFFPLYPLLIRFGGGIFGSEIVVGTLISMVGMFVATYLLYLLSRLEMTDRAARTTILLLALFPTSFFFSAVYTESLFLMLSLGAIYAARLDRWAVASLLAAAASASRINGLLLVVPLGLTYLYGPRRASAPDGRLAWWRPRYRITRSALWLLLVPAGLAAFLGYLWVSHDAPLAPFQVQEAFWHHQFAGPFGAVVVLAQHLPMDIHRILTGHPVPIPGDPLNWNIHDLIDVGFLVFAVAGLALSWRRVSLPLFAYGLVYLAYALSDPTATEALQGFDRYVLLAFPLFMGWGGWLAERRTARGATLVTSGVLLVGFSGLWAYWGWIG